MGLLFRRRSHGLVQLGLSAAAMALVTFVGYRFHATESIVVLLYLLVVVIHSLGGRFIESASICFLATACLDFFFLPPLFSFRIGSPLDLVSLFTFLTVALVITRLVLRTKSEARQSEIRGTQLEHLYEITQRLLFSPPDKEVNQLIPKLFCEVLPLRAVCLYDATKKEFQTAGTPGNDLSARTYQAFQNAKYEDDQQAEISVRCLRSNGEVKGAVGFEGLENPELTAASLAVLATATLERARSLENANYMAAAAQAEVFRTAILDALAHEFKTPLATISAVIGGIAESPLLGPVEREMAEMIESEVSRLTHLSNRLLRMAKLDRTEVNPRLKPTDLPAFVDRIVSKYRQLETGHDILVASAPKAIEVMADRELLNLAIRQLLENAFKYSVSGTPIRVNVRALDGSACVHVQNEGRSIPPKEKERIFERFYRGVEVRNTISGAGLGLYVARKIAVAHGGTLELEGEDAQNTVAFCLSLPIIKPQDVDSHG
jgi:two-component system, OmpR family, sensor histidine kinase KdpD